MGAKLMKWGLGSLGRKFYGFLRHPEAPPHWKMLKQELTCEHSDRVKDSWPTGEKSFQPVFWEKRDYQVGPCREAKGPPGILPFLTVSNWAGTKGVCCSSCLLNLMSQLRPESSYLADCNGPSMSASLYPWRVETREHDRRYNPSLFWDIQTI